MREDFSLSQLVLPKLDEVQEACEDVVRVGRVAGEIRVAICDGASRSSFPKQWAQLLADAYVEDPFGDDVALRDRTLTLAERWHDDVFSRDLPWHAEEKAQGGACTTLVGLRIGMSRWDAVAIGDTCLFHVRAGTLLTSFPITDVNDFDLDPLLLCSDLSRNDACEAYDNMAIASGSLESGDILIVATDGLARWLMRHQVDGDAQWTRFSSLKENELHQIVDRERTEGRMKNDDVACAWACI